MQQDAQTYTGIQAFRRDFPILEREIKPGVKLVYLDSTATAQKPVSVIQAMDDYYRLSNANIHRGVHTLAEEATGLYEDARAKVAAFIGAANPRQVIYTRNTTESINLVAYAWARPFLKEGDLVLLTEMEHHSNLVPWHMLAEERGVRLEFVPVTPEGLLDMEVYYQYLEQKPRLVAFTHMSNVLGTINPVKEMIETAHAVGAVTLVDAAQSVPHLPVNVQDLDADFLAFSAHKMYAVSTRLTLEQ
jgi:cysteine desulfurase/selenocysteine lyase